jgi:hypothetical protein
MMQRNTPGRLIGTILKHDHKINSYKIALLRAINDVALSFPDVRGGAYDVAVPLRFLAEQWIAYYWPFMDDAAPIWQGQRARLKGELRNDVSFRPELTELRKEWQAATGLMRPADGFYLISEMRVNRRRQSYPNSLVSRYDRAVAAISRAVEYPIRYAGEGEWNVFDRPAQLRALDRHLAAVPGARPGDRCLVVDGRLWAGFQELSLWVEALCIHEWCLFTERKTEDLGQPIGRGVVYQLLTDRPDNRRPLTWERNQVDLLMMEGREFRCPWTEKIIRKGSSYDLDHVVPLSVYPTNELWNLVPSDPVFNMHVKRDRLPGAERLARARPHLSGPSTTTARPSCWRRHCTTTLPAAFRPLGRATGRFPSW